jgi:hypothetical protein
MLIEVLTGHVSQIPDDIEEYDQRRRPCEYRAYQHRLDCCHGDSLPPASAREDAFSLEHDPEKCAAVFRKDHAQTK